MSATVATLINMGFLLSMTSSFIFFWNPCGGFCRTRKFYIVRYKGREGKLYVTKIEFFFNWTIIREPASPTQVPRIALDFILLTKKKKKSQISQPSLQAIERAWATSHKSKQEAKDLKLKFRILRFFWLVIGKTRIFSHYLELSWRKSTNMKVIKERKEHSCCREETQKLAWHKKSNWSLSKKKISNQDTQSGTVLQRTGMGLPISQNSAEAHGPLKNLWAEGKVMANRCNRSLAVKIKCENYAKEQNN